MRRAASALPVAFRYDVGFISPKTRGSSHLNPSAGAASGQSLVFGSQPHVAYPSGAPLRVASALLRIRSRWQHAFQFSGASRTFLEPSWSFSLTLGSLQTLSRCSQSAHLPAAEPPASMRRRRASGCRGHRTGRCHPAPHPRGPPGTRWLFSWLRRFRRRCTAVGSPAAPAVVRDSGRARAPAVRHSFSVVPHALFCEHS